MISCDSINRKLTIELIWVLAIITIKNGFKSRLMLVFVCIEGRILEPPKGVNDSIWLHRNKYSLSAQARLG